MNLAPLGPALRPALHTLWQTFTAAVAVWWTASGAAGIHAVTDVPSAERFALSAGAALLAALLSALFHVLIADGPGVLDAAERTAPSVLNLDALAARTAAPLGTGSAWPTTPAEVDAGAGRHSAP